jgi:hypothetical protein
MSRLHHALVASGLVVLLLAWGAAAPAGAAAPNGVAFQGLALDAAGSPINGTRDLVIRIFHDPTSVTFEDTLYEESHPGTVFVDGVFSIVIGAGSSPSKPFDETVFATAKAWLEVVVDDEVLAPRTKIQAVPYALQCTRAASASNESITSSAIEMHTIQGEDVAFGAIGSDEIGTGVVGSDEIRDNSIAAIDIATFAVGEDELASDAVTQSKIGSGAVGSDEVLLNSIQAIDIANDAVGADELALNAVESGEIVDRSIQSNDIGLGAVRSVEILDGSIAAADLGSGSVGSDEIIDESVGPADLASGAVGSDEIRDGSIAAVDIAAGAGSGLDADLLDGLNSISFLRSDVNDTYAGTALTIGEASTLRVNGSLSIGGLSAIDDDEVGFDNQNESIAWRNAETRFELSDDLAVDGEVSLLSPVQRFLTIAGTSFVPDPALDLWKQNLAGYGAFDATALPVAAQQLHAAVRLPAGTTVDQLRCCVYDDTTSDIEITGRFSSRAAASASAVHAIVASIATSGSSTAIQNATTVASAPVTLVDGDYYWISVEVEESGPFPPSPTRFYGCRLRYQVSSLTP